MQNPLNILKLCEYTKSHWTEYFKQVNCMLHDLWLNKAILKKDPPEPKFSIIFLF